MVKTVPPLREKGWLHSWCKCLPVGTFNEESSLKGHETEGGHTYTCVNC